MLSVTTLIFKRISEELCWTKVLENFFGKKKSIATSFSQTYSLFLILCWVGMYILLFCVSLPARKSKKEPPEERLFLKQAMRKSYPPNGVLSDDKFFALLGLCCRHSGGSSLGLRAGSLQVKQHVKRLNIKTLACKR